MISSRRIFLLITLLSVVSASVFGQDINVIALKQEHVAYEPKSFYVSNVTDSMPDDNIVGTITEPGGTQQLTMEGGAAAGLYRFISNNVKQNKSANSVELKLGKIDIAIKNSTSGWKVDVAIDIAFYASGINVYHCNGKTEGETTSLPKDFAEKLVREAVEKYLADFDKWWAEHKNSVPTTETVKVNVTMAKAINKPQCIVYSLSRPLAINDFRGPVQNDVGELAATYSGFSFASSGQTENGQIVINVVLTPYFDRSQSWFKEAGKNPVLLAHEQAHFDITAIKTCELANALRSAAFTKENYMTLFSQLEQQYTDESNEEQNTYDTETNHGVIVDKQQEWQNKIAAQVRAVGCY